MTHFGSVVVPCYNSAATIGECLASLENQTYPRDRYEVIVADNGSSDGGPDLIARDFPKVRMVHAARKGSGYARNAGIEAARGDVILSIDSDCVADRKWIERLIAVFDGAAGDVAAIGGAIEPYALSTPVEQCEAFWIAQANLRKGEGPIRYAETPNAAFRATALRSVGGFDGALGFDDADLGIRLGRAGFKVAFAPDAIVRHRNPASFSEIFRHRRRNTGAFNFTLARKYPDLFGDVTADDAPRPAAGHLAARRRLPARQAAGSPRDRTGRPAPDMARDRRGRRARQLSRVSPRPTPRFAAPPGPGEPRFLCAQSPLWRNPLPTVAANRCVKEAVR